MADVQTTDSTSRKGLRTPRPIRLDMTPLVDLAFLLLSFFVIATTIQHQQVMSLVLPPSGPGKPADNTLTFLLAHRGDYYTYRGAFDKYTTHLEHLRLEQVRTLLTEAKARREPVCVVKTHASTKYAGVIDLVDELEAHRIGHYALSDSLSGEESAMLEEKMRLEAR